jgi:hypothetical protein
MHYRMNYITLTLRDDKATRLRLNSSAILEYASTSMWDNGTKIEGITRIAYWGHNSSVMKQVNSHYVTESPELIDELLRKAGNCIIE